MSRKIIVGGLDPSFTASGLSKMSYDVATGRLEVLDLKLSETKPEATKAKRNVRASSDVLRRAVHLAKDYGPFFNDCAIVFSEVPTGGQSYDAVLGFGICIGLIAMVRTTKPITEIKPSETKLITGIRNADKPEMLEWAVERWPDAPWLRLNNKPGGRLLKTNHNLADACAVVAAGIELDEFQRSIAMMRAAA